MREFASLLDRLALTPQRNVKLTLLRGYFAAAPDPDRGYALAAIVGALSIPTVKPAMLRSLVAERVDAELFALSYDYIGDLAETISLIWPARRGANYTPSVTEVVETLLAAPRGESLFLVANWLDALDPGERWALIKLVTGGFRIGVSARLARQSLAMLGGRDANEIEEIWHGLSPPYTALFRWLIHDGPRPEPAPGALFRPVMLAHSLQENDRERIDPKDYAAEWKWDGIRIQAVSEHGERKLFSRTGDDISRTFPDLLEAFDFDGVIDGELMVFDPSGADFTVRPFAALQKRLNRKTAPAALRKSHPVFIRAYDLLVIGGDDLRALPFATRRARLEDWFKASAPPRFDLSPQIEFACVNELDTLRSAPPDHAVEGVMLKRLDAPYVPGRPKGQWWKWKRDPHVIDAVLMYAQRGHGRRSSFYSDFTFGVWVEIDGEETLAPVGKAYFGFTDDELKLLDRYVRANTIDRFGPVRQVAASPEAGLVLEIAFEGLNRSTRHKSGVAMRFPRIHRIRWDKPANEADRLETLEALLPPG